MLGVQLTKDTNMLLVKFFLADFISLYGIYKKG